MNRRVLLSIVAIIFVFVLAGCGKATSTKLAMNGFIVESKDSDTDSTVVSQNTKTTTQSTTSTKTQSYPITPETTTAMTAYKNVLQNKVEFFSTEENKNVYLNNLNYFNGRNYDGLVVTHFTIVDMDSDKLPEIVLEINSCLGFEVLHYEDGKVYGYNFVYRALGGLKTDGTFGFSNSAADNGYAKLRFLSNKYEYAIFANCKPSGQNSDGTTIESYYISNKSVSKESWKLFCKEQNAKKDAVWYELSEQNIEMQLSEN